MGQIRRSPRHCPRLAMRSACNRPGRCHRPGMHPQGLPWQGCRRRSPHCRAKGLDRRRASETSPARSQPPPRLLPRSKAWPNPIGSPRLSWETDGPGAAGWPLPECATRCRNRRSSIGRLSGSISMVSGGKGRAGGVDSTRSGLPAGAWSVNSPVSEVLAAPRTMSLVIPRVTSLSSSHTSAFATGRPPSPITRPERLAGSGASKTISCPSSPGNASNSRSLLMPFTSTLARQGPAGTPSKRKRPSSVVSTSSEYEPHSIVTKAPPTACSSELSRTTPWIAALPAGPGAGS